MGLVLSRHPCKRDLRKTLSVSFIDIRIEIVRYTVRIPCRTIKRSGRTGCPVISEHQHPGRRNIPVVVCIINITFDRCLCIAPDLCGRDYSRLYPLLCPEFLELIRIRYKSRVVRADYNIFIILSSRTCPVYIFDLIQN